MEAEEATSSIPQSSVVSSVVVVESKRVERPAETSRSRYLEKVKELDLEDLECRQELAEALGLERVSHEDLSRHQCVDWLKAYETHFSRARIMETADLMGIPTKSVMGPINYRPLIVEHRTSIARMRLATPAQLRVVDKLLDPREMELPDAAYERTRLADDPRYGKPCTNTQVGKTLAVYDRAGCCEGDHCKGIGLRGNLSQVVLAGDFGILTARSRAESNVNLGGSNKIGDAL